DGGDVFLRLPVGFDHFGGEDPVRATDVAERFLFVERIGDGDEDVFHLRPQLRHRQRRDEFAAPANLVFEGVGLARNRAGDGGAGAGAEGDDRAQLACSANHSSISSSVGTRPFFSRKPSAQSPNLACSASRIKEGPVCRRSSGSTTGAMGATWLQRRSRRRAWTSAASAR